MGEAVLVALITGACAIAAQAVIAKASARELYARLDKQSELSDAKLQQEIAVVKTEITELTREVREHNEFARRVPVLEEKAAAANRRLTDLENRREHA